MYRETVFADFGQYLAEQLQTVSMRTLIVEMHKYQSMGKLLGENSEEEYQYFCSHIIGEISNIKKLFKEYPVLCRCIEEKITACVNFYKNIIGQFFEDEEEIEERLCLMQKGLHIVHIESSHSDVHHGGQQVARVELSNGLSILYKPHSMLNEKKFTELLHWISAGIKIRQLDYDFLSYETHSWCTVVQYKCCHSKNEIREYYRRLGVQLFLAYFLGTHDLHYENVIASGEYPVIIDLETLTNVSRYEEQKTLDVSVRNKLSYSVLSTGLLPVYFWNTEGIGIDSSGISGGNENCYPFKIPIVVESGTSNMYIDYSYPKAKKKENRAMLGNVFCLPAEFETEFIEGFSLIDRCVKERQKMKLRLWKMRSRAYYKETFLITCIG